MNFMHYYYAKEKKTQIHRQLFYGFSELGI